MSDKIRRLLEKAEAQATAADSATSSVACSERDFGGAPEATARFAQFEAKLFHVERWNRHSALMAFALFNEKGDEAERRKAIVGDFIRLSLTGSGKNDWVKITRIECAPDQVILTVQPSYNPIENDADKNLTSHFFTDESTNNFCLQRNGALIRFHVIGLNEKTNTHDTKNILETVRNAATVNLGHYLGIQEAEWNAFCENFLENENV